MLKTVAFSLKRKIRVFKYNETGTGVDTARITTVLYPAEPSAEDTTDEPIDRAPSPDMFQEEGTLMIAYYAFQAGGEGHYNSFVSQTVSVSIRT